MKKALFLLLTLCLLAGLMAATVSAEELSGECNNGKITWTLDDAGTITFTGEGDIENLAGSSGHAVVQYSWTPYKKQIRRVIIGENIISVGHDAFHECINLTEVVLPESMRYIRDHAFYGCENLTSIDLPTKNPLYIGQYTFAGTGLTEIYLPDNVYDVDMFAFTRCKSLTKARLSNKQFYILRESVFANCTALTEIDFGTSISRIAGSALYNTGFTELVFPDTITFLDTNAVSHCQNLTTLDLGKVGSVRENAFTYCTALESVTVGPELYFIGWNAFKRCENIRDIYISDLTNWCLVEVEGTESSPVIYADNLYLNGQLVVDLVIPQGVTSVVSGFEGLSCIKTVMFADSVTKIYAAFQNCPNLTTAVIPATVTTLSNYSFYKCNGLKTIYYQGTEEAWAKIDPWKDNNSYYRPANAVIVFNYFSDVPATSFYAHPVLWAFENSIASGTAPATFSPAASCNRAQAVTFLWAAAGKPEPTITEHSFVDVPKGSFCEKAVLWAVEKGITTGTDETHFSPLATCNRATIVTFLYKAFGSPAVSAAENPFEDVPAESWYTAPALWAKENGITSGTDATHFSPASICNRAQIVTFLYGAYN